MKYTLIEGLYSIDGKIHIGYGVGHTVDSTLSFEDLTPDPTSVAKLVSLCNNLDLSPIHFGDVVEDFLIEST